VIVKLITYIANHIIASTNCVTADQYIWLTHEMYDKSKIDDAFNYINSKCDDSTFVSYFAHDKLNEQPPVQKYTSKWLYQYLLDPGENIQHTPKYYTIQLDKQYNHILVVWFDIEEVPLIYTHKDETIRENFGKAIARFLSEHNDKT
jgi:hypothetical protein